MNLRKDNLKTFSESFFYDNLNRLTSAQVTGQAAITMTYESNGNIQTKTGVGTYIYSTTHPNAVELFQCEPTTQTTQQNILTNAFNKTEKITEGDYELTLTYGPDQQRKMSILKYQNAPKCTVIYAGNYEKIIYNGGNTYEVHYIAGGSGLTAINVRTNGSVTDELFYVYTDHLGSLLTITNASGTIIYETNYDAWGRERNPATWDYTTNPNTPPEWLIRGFTGHEHLKEFALINMNGRVYDPLLGRFNAPDNFVQDPYFSQTFNRYSYALNNPLVFTDPTGNEMHETYPTYVFELPMVDIFGYQDRDYEQEMINDFWSQMSDIGGGGYSYWDAFKILWNMRVIGSNIPDNISIDLNLGSVLVAGASVTYVANILTRGQQPGLHFTRTEQIRMGGEVDWGININFSNYQGNPLEIDKASLEGPIKSMSVGFLYGGNVYRGYNYEGDLTWEGFGTGIGFTYGFSYGYGTTYSSWYK